jgi:hypothetical protein
MLCWFILASGLIGELMLHFLAIPLDHAELLIT